jgi:hypothetical protein
VDPLGRRRAFYDRRRAIIDKKIAPRLRRGSQGDSQSGEKAEKTQNFRRAYREGEKPEIRKTRVTSTLYRSMHQVARRHTAHVRFLLLS